MNRWAVGGGVAALVGLSMVVNVSPAAAGYSSLDGSPETIAITAGTGMWAEAGAVAAGATGTAAGIAGTAAASSSGLSFGTLGVSTLGAAAVSVGGWYAGIFHITGPVPVSLIGTTSVYPPGFTAAPVYSYRQSGVYSGADTGQDTMTGAVVGHVAGQNDTVVMTVTRVGPTTAYSVGGQYAVSCRSPIDPTSIVENAAGVSAYGVHEAGTWTISSGCESSSFPVLDHLSVRTGSEAAGTTANRGASWFPPGDARAPEATAVLHGTLVRRLDCINAAGAIVQMSSGATITLAADGSYPVDSMVCPAGSVTSGFGAKWTPDGGATVDVVPWTSTATWVAAVPASQPACLTEVCYLRLYEVGVAGAPATSCGDAAVACPDWYTDPNKTADYECHWGPYVVDFNACSAFRKPGEVLPNTTTTTDPATGQKTGTATIVTTLPNTADDPVTSPSGAPGPTPESGECFPSGFGMLNPIEWVLKPVGCALSWAFVPKNDVMSTQLVPTRDLVMAKPPMSLFAVVGPMLTGVATGWTDGCASNLADFGPTGLAALPIPCHPPASPAWTVVYLLVSGGIIVAAALNVWSMLVGALGGRATGGEEG